MSAFDRIATEIRRHGPVPFDRVMEIALYDAECGFYERGGVAGRRGDFLTSPEVGPLFGAVVARAIDAWWRELGEPDPFVVVEVGAGPGTLAIAVRAARPACARALRYVLVERSAAQRARHGEHLELSTPAMIRAGCGPQFVSLGELPGEPFTGVVLANELLDNMAFRLLRRRRDGWMAVHAGLDIHERGLVAEELPASSADAELAGRLAPGVGPGSAVPIQHEAVEWIRRAVGAVQRGRVVVIDYASTTAAMAERGEEWLRTYRAHDRGGAPLEDLGEQDITTEVATDQLARVRVPDLDRSQAEFLAAHGIEELVDAGRAVWKERAHLGDLEALRARSRVTEADALTDDAGLGAFRVLEWVV